MDERAEGEPLEIQVQPRIYLNGFPKSGLHLAVLMARTIEEETALDPPWVGSFGWNAWSTEWRPLPHIFAGLRQLRNGTWLKGHCGYRPEIEQYLYWHGTAMAFIYRDLRDVLVSQSYHVIAEDDERFYHPGKDMFRELNHEERLLACLHGIGPFSGLFARWTQYAPWLAVEWVHKIRFEDMIGNREQVAQDFAQYIYDRTCWGVMGAEVVGTTLEKISAAIAHNMTITSMSSTYRKGTSGQWREEFTTRVTDEFKAVGGDWLVRLGYERDDTW